MKKVLMVADRGLGRAGIPAVMMSVIRGLKDEYRFDLVLFTQEVRYYDAEALSYGTKIYRLPRYNGKFSLRKKLDYYLRGGLLYRGITRLLKENGPYDVIHCNNFFESALCLKAAYKAGVPVRIAHFHTRIENQRFPLGWVNKQYLKLVRKYATHKVACSPDAGRSVFGNDQEFAAIYNAYDERKFVRQDDSAGKPGTLTMLQIGSYSDNKNQLFSLEVLRSILDRGENASLHFVGFGEYRKKVEQRVDELQLAEHVYFHEADADTPKLLSQSAAFLFPSKQEGFGIVLVEAQAMGVRCYASDSLPRDADVGGCCFLPLQDGADAWAERIIADYQASEGLPGDFDCSAFTTDSIMKSYRKIYRGE